VTPDERLYRDAWLAEMGAVVRQYHEPESAPETRIPQRVEKARDEHGNDGRAA
jgi:hypothetical protein